MIHAAALYQSPLNARDRDMIGNQTPKAENSSTPHPARFSMTNDSPQGCPHPAAEQPARPREIDSAELMCGQREIVIRHGQELYRLNVTRSGKLILRK